jgi:hypothetical protein
MKKSKFGRINFCFFKLWKSIQGVFFYFGMFDIVIFWSIFDQKSCSLTFFISTFCSYFVKKITEHLCHYFSFYRIFRKGSNFGEIFKKNPLFWRNYNKTAIISQFQPIFLLKLHFSIANTVTNTKNTKKSLIHKLVKIINFLIKKWKNEIFSKILKIGTFTKT